MSMQWDSASDLWEKLSYAASAGLTFTGMMDWLNKYAAACGVLLAMVTYLTNLAFKLAHRRSYQKAFAKIDPEKRRKDDIDISSHSEE